MLFIAENLNPSNLIWLIPAKGLTTKMQTYFNKMLVLSLLALPALCVVDPPWTPPPKCRKMKHLYAGGKGICEKMWDGAFKYEKDEENAYTMWFFDAHNNPNDKTTERLAANGMFELDGPVDQCYLQSLHKEEDELVNNEDHPTEQPDTFRECHPYAQNGCCPQDLVSSVDKIKDLYEKKYHWDRCGKMSQACERFFVMEACFYQCDTNAGLFRKHKADAAHPDPFGGAHPLYDPTDEDTNAWRMKDMPIKASFCDAWWNACQEDYFCTSDGGSFFSCADDWEPFDEEQTIPGSCKGSCGGKAKDGPCRCDAACEEEEPNTCCGDREVHCQAQWVLNPVGSCEGTCNKKTATEDGTCWCDKGCVAKGDCCKDIDETCPTPTADFKPGSCAGACGKKTKTPGGTCYCDKVCHLKPDCCEDAPTECPNAYSGGGCEASGDC